MTARQLAVRPHPDDRNDRDKSGPQMMRQEAVNIAESPIAWLSDIRWRVMWAGEGIAGGTRGWAGQRGRASWGWRWIGCRGFMGWDSRAERSERPIAGDLLPLRG